LPMIAGALLTQKAPVAQASAIAAASASTEIDLVKILPAMFIHLTFSVTIFLLYKLGKFLYKEFNVMRVIIPSTNSYYDTRSCDIYMEFNSGLHSCLLYVCTIRANSSDCHVGGKLTPNIVEPGYSCFKGHINLDWEGNNFMLYVSRQPLKLPSVIYIPILKRRVIRCILRQPFIIRVLIGQHGIFTELGRKSHNYVVRMPESGVSAADSMITACEI